MEFNPEIRGILSEFHINHSDGLLALVAIYYDLEAERTISEEVMKKINLTHIVEKDYTDNSLRWNVPLFANMEADAFDWVGEWIEPFGKIGGPSRKGVKKECVARMKRWFAENPEYRKKDVFDARDLYFRTEKPIGEFVKTSHKFIQEGAGATKTSMLLLWCERLRESSGNGGQKWKGKLL